MTGDTVSVLLVENDATVVAQIQAALGHEEPGPFRVEWCSRLDDALKRLQLERMDVILLGLELPDTRGMEAFERIFQTAPQSAVFVLCTTGNEALGQAAVQHGAQDYFLKNPNGNERLPLALRQATDRLGMLATKVESVVDFRAMNDASPLGILIADVRGDCIYTNPVFQRMSGLQLEEALGTTWAQAVHPQDRTRVLEEWRNAMHTPLPFSLELRFLRRDGQIVWGRAHAMAMHDGERLRGYILSVEDVTEQQSAKSVLEAAKEALFEEKERAQVTLNSIADGVICADVHGYVMYLNRAAERLTGWPLAEAAGRMLDQVFDIVDTKTVLTATPADAERPRRSSMLIRRDGEETPIEDSLSPMHDSAGNVIGSVVVFHDVSETHAMAAKMAHLAQYDFLTDLPNRLLLNDRLTQAISLAQRHQQQLALMFLDLDHFKHINDSLGHAVGDQLLQLVAVRLKACVRSADTLCRQGGDEFVVLLPEIEDAQDAALVAAKMMDAFAQPLIVEGHELDVSLSIGISIFPEDGRDLDTIVKNADIAMYHAKENGRNNYQFFTPEINARAVQRNALKHSLHRAMDRKEFVLHYQSKIDLETGHLTGVEALLRWHHPEQGFIEPSKFVSVAEDCGLIGPIGQWVLQEACGQVQAWHAAGLPIVPVSVNISAVEFKNKNFLQNLSNILEDTGLKPEFLELELTESVMLQDIEATSSVMQSLKDMGIRLTIDDFGTGYSNLSYLKHFPIDTLKIDQSFVRDVTTDMGDATIVRAILNMARSLKLRAIAEGVETPAHLAFLQALQCDEGQGYYFSRPVRAGAFESMLTSDSAASLVMPGPFLSGSA